MEKSFSFIAVISATNVSMDEDGPLLSIPGAVGNLGDPEGVGMLTEEHLDNVGWNDAAEATAVFKVVALTGGCGNRVVDAGNGGVGRGMRRPPRGGSK
jgi:hypothetical protein